MKCVNINPLKGATSDQNHCLGYSIKPVVNIHLLC